MPENKKGINITVGMCVHVILCEDLEITDHSRDQNTTSLTP